MVKFIPSIFILGQPKQLVLPRTVAFFSDILNFEIRPMGALKLVFSSIHLLRQNSSRHSSHTEV
jgi:hypothetical protein